MRTKSFVILVLLIVVVGGAIAGAFVGGQAVGKSQAKEEATQALRSRFGQFPSVQQRIDSGNLTSPGGTVFVRGGAFGTVERVEGNKLTVKALDGSTIEVVINEQTSIQKMARGNLSDIVAGSSVTVTGDKKDDGSIVAATIFITPAPQAR